MLKQSFASSNTFWIGVYKRIETKHGWRDGSGVKGSGQPSLFYLCLYSFISLFLLTNASNPNAPTLERVNPIEAGF